MNPDNSSIKHLFLLIFILFSCEKEVEQNPSIVSIKNSQFIYAESDPDFNIPVKLSQTQFGYVSTKYFMETDTSAHNGDDYYIADQPVIIYGGYLAGNINVAIYDDSKPDGNDTLVVELKSTTENSIIDPIGNKSKIIILDDDNYPANEMHIHLNWNGDKLDSGRNEFDYNMNLTLLKDVVMDEGGIVSSTIVRQANDVGKFEDLIVMDTDPDAVYYITGDYISNLQDDDKIEIKGIIKFSGFGYSDANTDKYNYWNFSLPQPHYYFYLGPFKKVGQSFVLQK